MLRGRVCYTGQFFVQLVSEQNCKTSCMKNCLVNILKLKSHIGRYLKTGKKWLDYCSVWKFLVTNCSRHSAHQKPSKQFIETLSHHLCWEVKLLKSTGNRQQISLLYFMNNLCSKCDTYISFAIIAIVKSWSWFLIIVTLIKHVCLQCSCLKLLITLNP